MKGVPSALRYALYGVGVVLFVLVVVARGGPATGDAFAVVNPTTQLSHGDLGAAAAAQSEYQPPGYSVMVTPLVVVFRSLLGSPTWCDTQVTGIARALEASCQPDVIAGQHWYRSQALLGIAAWMILAIGAVSLLRAAGLGDGWAGPLTVMALAVLPAAGDCLVQTFHPQDLVCVGLLTMAMAQALRRRWVATGVLFAVALTCKQFALLALVPVLVAAPGWRQRARILVPAGLVFAAIVAPFLVVNRSATLAVLEAVSTGGANKISAGTVVSLAPLSESAKLFIARAGAPVLALVVSVVARRRVGGAVFMPVPLIGLVAACLAGRLVFEVWIFGYYLLAVGVSLLLVDVACRRPPLRSIIWIAATTALAGNLGALPLSAAAAMWLVSSLGAVAMGVRAVTGEHRAAVPVFRGRSRPESPAPPSAPTW